MNWFKKPASKTWYNIFLTIVKNFKGEMIIKYFRNIFIIWIVITIGVSQTYFPPYGDWERKQAAEVGMNESKLNRAMQFAIKSESAGSRDLKEYIKATLTKEPHGEIIGPTKPRGDMTGLIIKNG